MVVLKRTANAVIAITTLLACMQSVHAQNKKLYSLAELVDSTKNYFPSLLQKQALANSAKAGVIEAKHAYLPKLAISDEALASSANSLPGSYFPIGSIPSVSASINAQNNSTLASGNIASLYTEYELMNFGLRNAKTKNAQAFAGLQQADFDKELYIVKWQIGRLYFDLLKSKYQLAVDDQNIKRYEFLFTVSAALSASGLNAGVDSSIAKAELSKTKIAYNNRQGEIERLQQQLNFYTGISDEIDIDTSQKKLLVTNNLYPTVADTLQNPLTDYFSKQELLYKSNEYLINKMFLPKLMLAAGGWGRGSSIDYTGQYKNFSNGLGYQRFSYGIAIGITYDLLNGIRKKDKLGVSRFQTAAAGYETQQQKNSLRLGAVQADISVKVAEKNLQELPAQLDAASGAFEQKVAQYKAGIINLIDLTNASFVLYTAQSAYVQTQNEWLIANLNKAAVAGQLDFFIQSIKK